MSKVPLLALFEVFYYKMKGDYFRYIAEFTEGEGKTGAANSAHDACAMLVFLIYLDARGHGLECAE